MQDMDALLGIWGIFQNVFTETRKTQDSELEGGGCGGGTIKLTPGQAYFYNILKPFSSSRLQFMKMARMVHYICY